MDETDVYKVEAEQAKGAYKELAELAAALGQNTAALATQNDMAAASLEREAAAAKRAAAAANEHGRETKTLSSFIRDDLNRSLLTAAAQYDILKAAISGTIAFGRESIQAAMEQEQAELRLSNALRTAGYSTAALASNLSDLAQSFQETAGVDDSMTQGVMALLVQMGVAPLKVEAVTQSVLDYAAATGKDAHTATVTLMRALDGESEELRGLGVNIERTGDKTKDLDNLVAAVAERFEGSAKSATQGMAGQVNALGFAWDDLKKAVGFALADMANTTMAVRGINAIAEALDWKRRSAKESAAVVAAAEQERLEESIRKTEKAMKDLVEEIASGDVPDAFLAGTGEELEQLTANAADLKRKLAELRGEVPDNPQAGPAFGPKLDREKLGEAAARQREKEAAAAKKAQDELLRELESSTVRWDDRMAQMGIEATQREGDEWKKRIELADEALKERNAKIESAAKDAAAIEQRQIDKLKRDKKDGPWSAGELAVELEARLAAISQHNAREAAAIADLRAEIGRTENADLRERLSQRLEAMEKGAAAELEIERKLAADIAELRERQKALDAQFRAQMVDIAAQGLNQIFATELTHFIDSATASRAYTAAMMERSIERRQIENEELGVMSTRADIEADLASESEAADKKRLASTLASIAASSAIEAMKMGAKAVERAVEYDYAGAAQAGVAAGLYTAVAIAAGGAAAGVNNSRGMTGDEKASLAAFDKRKDDAAKKREKKQGGQGGADSDALGGTTITVINYGITGQTQEAQGRELERIRAQYGRGSVGGKGF